MHGDTGGVVERAYRERGPFRSRAGIYRFQRDRVDLPGLAVQRLADVRGLVLDAGCGLGTYTERLRRDRPDLRVLALDRSPAMAAEVVADLRRLPVADGAAGAVLAMHVLYHLDDLPAAVGELRRVVRPDGVVLASTNGRGDKREVHDLWSAVLRDLTGRDPEPYDEPAARFTLDDGDVLRARLGRVEVVVFERVTAVPERAPMVDYVASLRAGAEPRLPAGVDWAAFLRRAAERVEAEVAARGAFRMTNRVGVFTCRP